VANDYDYDDPEGEALEERIESYEKPQWLRNMPYWALSGFLHLILLLVFVNIVVDGGKGDENAVPIEVRTPPKPPKYDPMLKRDVKKTPKLLNKPVVDPVVKKKIDEVALQMPKGTDLNNLTNVDLQQQSIHDIVGVGGGGAGAYGERQGRGSLSTEGGGGTEESVRAALEWLRRHQSPDGSWKSRDFLKQCKAKCVSEDAAKYGDGSGLAEFDVGVTGLAILAFAGYGHTHRDGVYPEYVAALKKAVKYLKRVQNKSGNPSDNGRYGDGDAEQWIYNHAIATMAMAELLVMSGDIIGLQKSVTDAVKLCLRAQNDERGWRYGIKPGDNDTSVTGWMVLALKTAKNADLDIRSDEYKKALEGALTWFNFATATNGKAGYVAPGDAGSRLATIPEPYPYSKDLSCMTAVSVLCRLFAGESRSTSAIRDGVKILMKELPIWQEQKGRATSTINMYYWYYASYALFQYGGAPWKEWNDDMKKALITTQRAGNIDEDGSWDPIGEWGIAGGRVYSTAIGAMTLEVYYRFRRLQTGAEF